MEDKRASSNSLPAVLDLIHILSESAEALDKSARILISADEMLSEDEAKWRWVEDVKARQSLFKDLEWKTQQRKIPYDDLARLLKIMLREVAKFKISLNNVGSFLGRDGEIDLLRSNVRLVELLDEIVDLFEFAAKEKGVEIDREYLGDPIVRLDRNLFERALVNLLDNAVKYSFSRSERGGRRFVQVQMRRHSVDGRWLIAIQSYGVGILPEEIQSGSIFEYGVRGTLARDRKRLGSGIGLAESKRIVEAHQGRLQLESRCIIDSTYLTIASVIVPAL